MDPVHDRDFVISIDLVTLRLIENRSQQIVIIIIYYENCKNLQQIIL